MDARRRHHRPVALGLATLLLLGLAACSGSSPDPELSALHHFRQGNAALVAEDYPRAIRHYQRAVELDDRAPDIAFNLGVAYQRVGAYAQAVQAYQRALELKPDQPDVQLNLALAYDKLYNLPAANDHYNAYRRLTVGPQAAAEAPPPAAAQVSAKARPQAPKPSNLPTPEALAQRGLRKRSPAPSAPAQQPAAEPPTGQRRTITQSAPPPAPPRSGSAEPLLGGTKKWWTQDQYLPKP
ncbi:MAG: tetratricopeptide repeat protein [Candidatus Lambdaproteobacteria bacterium]|nr:tetratricopeptide repeat protein [Candidatus Lambdaproteobacteria bacterium]